MLKVKGKAKKLLGKAVTGRNAECTRCVLHKTSEANGKSLVCLWGHGNPSPSIVFVGEAPGKDEIIEEIPFIGDAGKLFNKYSQKVGIDRKDVYIANTVKCRPPGNRTPKPLEIKSCAPYLDYEIQQKKPKVIGILGAVALKRILGVEGITKLRGVPIWSDKYKCYCVPTWHPSYILRNGETFEHTEQFMKDLQLIKQIGETGKVNKLDTNVIVCDTEDKVAGLLSKLRTTKLMSVDTETVGTYLDGKILMIQFSWKPGEAWILPFYKADMRFTTPKLIPIWKDDKWIWNDLKVILEDKNIKKVGQNIAYDYKFFKLYGIHLQGVVFDTMLADYLLNENDKKGHGLRDLALRFTDMGDYALEFYEILGVAEKDIDENTYATAPFDALCKYSGKDSDCTLRVFYKLYPKIKNLNLLPLLSKVMVPLSFALADMEIVGVAVDVDYYIELAKQYEKKIVVVEKTLNEFPEILSLEKEQGKPVNFRSTKQLRRLFYEMLELPIYKYTSNKKKKNKKIKTPSTDQEVLEKLAEHHQIPKVLQEHRKLTKFLSTNIKPVPDLAVNGRLHTSYQQTTTVTGRLSSSKPNLQNIPKKEPEKAREVRHGIIATPGFKFIAADFSQIEFRLLLNESGDEQGIKDINDGLDIHRTIASLSFNIQYDKVTKEQRETAKTTGYSIIYGKSKENLAKETGLTEEQIEQIFDVIFTRYKRVKPYMTAQVNRAKSVGEVINWIGRRRRLADGFKSGVDILMAEAERQAVNSPIQGGAHDILSISTLRVRKAFRERNLQSRLVMTTHDELIAEAKDEETDEVISIFRREMEKPVPKIKVPMTIDIKTGVRLSEMVELKEEKVQQ